MYCENCGKELDDNWIICPYCQTDIKQTNESIVVEDNIKETITKWGEGVAFLMMLYKKHPVRFLMCIPVWIYVIYLIFTMNITSTFAAVGFGEAFGELLGYMIFAGLGSWCLYGPINSREIRDVVRNNAHIETEKDVEDVKPDSEDADVLNTLFQKHPVRFLMCIPVWIYMICVTLSMNIEDIFSVAGVLRFIGHISFAMACSWCLYGPINLREVRRIVERKEINNLGIRYLILYVLLAVLLISCGAEEQKYTQAENYTNDYTIEEYLNNCIVVDLETLARNPDDYVGKHIIVEGSLGTTFGVVHVGLWTTVNPVVVDYDGMAYGTNLNEVGNILNDDYGYVAGQFMEDGSIDGVIVIVE